MRTIDALHPPDQWRVISESHEFDDDILLVTQIIKTLSNLLDEICGDVDRLFVKI